MHPLNKRNMQDPSKRMSNIMIKIIKSLIFKTVNLNINQDYHGLKYQIRLINNLPEAQLKY